MNLNFLLRVGLPPYPRTLRPQIWNAWKTLWKRLDFGSTLVLPIAHITYSNFALDMMFEPRHHLTLCRMLVDNALHTRPRLAILHLHTVLELCVRVRFRFTATYITYAHMNLGTFTVTDSDSATATIRSEQLHCPTAYPTNASHTRLP